MSETSDLSDAAPEAAPTPDAPPELRPEERRVLITGFTSGIGRALAHLLAARGNPLMLVCRDRSKGERTVEELRVVSPEADITLETADLSLMSQVRDLARRLAARPDPIDTLVNNAGTRLSERRLTAEGHETMLATNHLAPYLLTELLTPVLERRPGGRVVTVNSFLHSRVSTLDDPQSEQFSALQAYSRSKFFNLLTSYAQAEALADHAVRLNAYNPGFVRTAMTTGGFIGIVAPLFAKSPKTAAGTLAFLAVSPRVAEVTGQYYLASGRPTLSSAASRDADLQQQAVALTRRLLGEDQA